MVRQMLEKEAADSFDYFVGDPLIAPDIKRVASRNVMHPRTADTVPRATLDSYEDGAVSIRTNVEAVQSNNGVVHIFSRMPNYAFAVRASQFWNSLVGYGR